MKTDTQSIRNVIQTFVGEKLLQQGRDASDQLEDDCDLLVEGYIDSMGVVELTAHLETHFGAEIDYDDLDPEQMTIVGPLAAFVSDQLAA